MDQFGITSEYSFTVESFLIQIVARPLIQRNDAVSRALARLQQHNILMLYKM